MEDTAQPVAAETDPYAAAAQAFKMFSDEPPQEPLRDDQGRFAREEEEQPEATEQAEPDSEPEGDDIDDDEPDTEAAEEDEAQPDPDMPSSWSKEDEEIWRELPATAKAKIAEREAQRDQAVNQKFQEAANVRKQSESEFREAQQSRQQMMMGLRQVMNGLVAPKPPVSMLDQRSPDYNPNEYHLMHARHEQSVQYLNQLEQQRQQIAQQYQVESERYQAERFAEIENATRPAFFEEVPDAKDPEKLPGILHGLIDYAANNGAPREMFDETTTALEWRMLWKAREYDRLTEASGKVRATEPPKPKKAAPPVRPGVATTRQTVAKQKQAKAVQRLKESGSIEAGAAVFKQFF